MFDVGFAELFLLFILGLLVLGPERLPAVARTLGGFVRKARMSYHNLKRTVEAELAAAEAANPVNEAKRELESVRRQVRELGDSLDQKIDRVEEVSEDLESTGKLPAPETVPDANASDGDEPEADPPPGRSEAS